MNNFDKLYKAIMEGLDGEDVKTGASDDAQSDDNTSTVDVELDDIILVRPLSNDQLAQLKSGNNINIKITPDTYLNRFKNLPYNSAEEMNKKTKIYSKTTEGEFTYDITSVAWSPSEIIITVQGTGASVDNNSNDDDSDDSAEESK